MDQSSKFSDDQRLIIGEASRNRWNDASYRKLMSEKMSKKHACHSNEHKLLIGLATKKRWQSLEYRNRLKHSEARKQRSSELMIRLWQNQEYAIKVSAKTLKSNRENRPNKPELKLLSLLESNFPGDWRYVGDGSFWIGGRNPDFLSNKRVIELFGDYWHKGENPKDRIDYFRAYGFETLVIWESELSNPANVEDSIKRFCHS